MLLFYVFVATHFRRSPLSRRSFHLPSHLSLFTVVHPLSVQLLTKCSSRNSFVFKTIHFDGGCVPSSAFGRSDLPTFRRVSELSPFFSYSCALISTTGAVYLLSLQSLAHSFHGDGGCTPFRHIPSLATGSERERLAD